MWCTVPLPLIADTTASLDPFNLNAPPYKLQKKISMRTAESVLSQGVLQ